MAYLLDGPIFARGAHGKNVRERHLPAREKGARTLLALPRRFRFEAFGARVTGTPMFSRRAIEAFRKAKSVAVLTGAGVSAESGVPTFRGAGGLWRERSAASLATPEAFRENPRLVWEFYAHRRETLAPLAPNPGHYAIASMEERFARFTLITQNIDNLHRVAGTREIVELHGSIWRVRCANPSCGRAARSWENRDVPLDPLPPRCEACGGLLRPDVVWFGETLDPARLRRAMAAVDDCDYLIAAGTSAVVQPAASMPMAAARGGAFTLEVNPEPTEISPRVSEAVEAPSGAALPRLLEAAFGG